MPFRGGRNGAAQTKICVRSCEPGRRVFWRPGRWRARPLRRPSRSLIQRGATGDAAGARARRRRTYGRRRPPFPLRGRRWLPVQRGAGHRGTIWPRADKPIFPNGHWLWYDYGQNNDPSGTDYIMSIDRFISRDPLGYAGSPINLYEYCGDNPLGNTDPSGLSSEFAPACITVPGGGGSGSAAGGLWVMEPWYDTGGGESPFVNACALYQVQTGGSGTGGANRGGLRVGGGALAGASGGPQGGFMFLVDSGSDTAPTAGGGYVLTMAEIVGSNSNDAGAGLVAGDGGGGDSLLPPLVPGDEWLSPQPKYLPVGPLPATIDANSVSQQAQFGALCGVPVQQTTFAVDAFGGPDDNWQIWLNFLNALYGPAPAGRAAAPGGSINLNPYLRQADNSTPMSQAARRYSDFWQSPCRSA